jgi:hypothetical protein
MGTRNLKMTGFSQGLFEQSKDKKEPLGKLRFTEDGRAFRYARAGATALTAGYALYLAEATANHIKQVNTGYTMAVGAYEVTLLLGATAVTANMYDDGYLQIYDGAAAAVGQNLQISSHDTAALSTACKFRLKDPVLAACIATDTYSLIPNPWNGLVASAAVAHGFGGVAPIAVTANYYFWTQVGGTCCVLNHTTTPLGSMVGMSAATTGALATAAAFTSLWVGEQIGYAAIADKYVPVQLRRF